MLTLSYQRRRSQIESYFDRTAAQSWAHLTSDKPLNGVRAAVRRGRDRMRAALLGYLPQDLRGQRVLDAGCGTGLLAVEAARRGAEVVAIDLSPTLVRLAIERVPGMLKGASIDFQVGDMLDPSLGEFDHVVAMDSLIHYQTHDMVGCVAGLAARARKSVVFTFVPSTPLLRMMHLAGQLFPRGNRSPNVEPVRERSLREAIAENPALRPFREADSVRVKSAFYVSQTLQLVRG